MKCAPWPASGPLTCTPSHTFCIAMPKSLSGPAQRAEKRPGSPFSASTQRPLSSASAGRPLRSAACIAFSSAFAMKVVPVSSGSGRSSDAAEIGSIP